MDLFSILILLPIGFFLLLFLHGTAAWRDETAGRDWRFAFLVAAVVWGGIVALSTELLSLFDAVTRLGLALVWVAALGVLYVWSGGLRRVREGIESLRQQRRQMERWEWAVVVGLLGIAVLLLSVAWVSPPNNVDSLLYHMARVVHWAQNQSIEHYPVVFHHQLMMPPWSEEAILQLRVLWGSDWPAALVQWFSMVGSLVVSGWLAKRLGAGREGQAATVVFVATIPMGILQATSTQNDYTVGFWLLATLAFMVGGLKSEGSWDSDIGVGAAAGLGLLTKATFYIYVLPVIAGYIALRFWRNGIARALTAGLIVASVVLALNLGFWARNLQTFGRPLGGLLIHPATPFSSDLRLESLETQPYSAAGPGEAKAAILGGQNAVLNLSIGREPPNERHMEIVSTPSILSSGIGNGIWDGLVNAFRRSVNNVFLHFVTPSSAVNELIKDGLMRFPGVFRADYFAEYEAAAWNHEDTAGNPLHLLLVFVSLAVMLVTASSGDRRGLVYAYLGMVLAGFLLLTYFFSGLRIYRVRYHLPFFVAIAPTVGLAIQPLFRGRLRYLIALGLLAALPWILLNNMRPIIGVTPWPTRTESVFTRADDDGLLAIAPNAVDEYSAAAQSLRESGCTDVGLGIGQQDLEYAFWWLLDAPQSGIRLEVINPSQPTARYLDPDFEPCAVLCTRCQQVAKLSDMEHVGSYDNYELYLETAGP